GWWYPVFRLPVFVMAAFEPIVESNIKPLASSGVPWVITHETFSIVPTLVMDAQTLTGTRVRHSLWVKLYKLYKVKTIRITVSRSWTRYESLTMISRGVNSLIRDKGCVRCPGFGEVQQ